MAATNMAIWTRMVKGRRDFLTRFRSINSDRIRASVRVTKKSGAGASKAVSAAKGGMIKPQTKGRYCSVKVKPNDKSNSGPLRLATSRELPDSKRECCKSMKVTAGNVATDRKAEAAARRQTPMKL